MTLLKPFTIFMFKFRFINIIKLFLIFFSLLISTTHANNVKNFLFIGGDANNLEKYKNIINKPNVFGVQIVYNWKELEPQKEKYDFSKIKQNLQFINNLDKKLFIQIQDRFFEPNAKYLPSYIINNPLYDGGIVKQLDRPGEAKALVSGWVAKQWNPKVREQFQKLLLALANEFDGKIYGINLPETALDIISKNKNTKFSCDKYFNAEIENIKFAKKVFKKSFVVQYINFFPCEWENNRNYMSRLFELAYKNNIGLGNPDIVPYKKSQMKNSYYFFHKYRKKLSLVAMAVQEPTMTYINPKTKMPFTKKEIYDFANNYLGVDIIFWNILMISK